MPKISQIQGIIKPKDIISIGDVVSWSEEHLINVDLNIDAPFVIDFKASTYEDEEKDFQYTISTKRLLSQSAHYEAVCMDATYKVNFHGYPLLMIGSIDANRKFHLIALSVSEKTADYEFLFQGK